MQPAARGRRTHAEKAVLAVSRRFGRYHDEQEKDLRKAEVTSDPVLEQLKAAWKGLSKIGPEYYKSALESLKGIEYSSKDVENFSIAMTELQDEGDFSIKAGYFLSALINNGKDADYAIHTQHLTQKIGYLGYRNTKNITLNGQASWFLGSWMECGSIIVDGDAESNVGIGMKGGAITVNGDAGSHIGVGMNGGSITVNGNAGNNIGSEMKGGEVHLEGDYRGLSESILGGKIYHRGKLIVDK